MQILRRPFFIRLTAIPAVVRSCICVFTLLAIAGMRPPFQGDPESRASQVKAVFLYNFSQFITWPESSFSDPNSPFVIGVLGKNTFGPYLNDVIESEKVNGRPISIKYFTSLTPEIDDCEILFIDKSFPAMEQAIKSTKGKPILTVSDNELFMKQSGILRFYIEGGKLRIEVNQEASSGSGLEISSKLLRIATLYKN
jgi:hypothetical protein